MIGSITRWIIKHLCGLDKVCRIEDNKEEDDEKKGECESTVDSRLVGIV